MTEWTGRRLSWDEPAPDDFFDSWLADEVGVSSTSTVRTPAMLTALTVLAYWCAASVLVAAGWAAWREVEKRLTGR